MAGVRRSVARMGDAHVAQPEPNREAASDPLSVARKINVERGVRWGRCSRRDEMHFEQQVLGEPSPPLAKV